MPRAGHLPSFVARSLPLETVGPYLALRLRPERVPAATRSTIEGAVPNRVRYLDCLGLTMELVP